MSTVFLRVGMISLVLGACAGHSEPGIHGKPAPPAPEAREWRQITVNGPYGPLEIAVPVVILSTASGASGSIVVDSIALREVEKRLTARIATIARSQAAFVADTTESRIIKRNPAPVIKPGLLGEIPFEDDTMIPTAAGAERIAAVARLLRELRGRIDIVAHASGTGAASFDAAATRARRVYLRLLEAEPRLAERELRFMVSTQAVLPGAPVPDPVVEVYYSAQ